VTRVDEPRPTVAGGFDEETVNRALASWHQGDCVLADEEFLFRLHRDAPLTHAAVAAAAQGANAATEPVRGLAVVTQTCDIVRDCRQRPFVQVSPLVTVGDQGFREIRRGLRPNYAFLPGLDSGIVVDLDRVMTVEKSVVAAWMRTAGATSEKDTRAFQVALARNRSRFAFPDDFVVMASPLMRRMARKHGVESEEGRALRALREIRVRAEPSWSADEVRLFYFFIRDESTTEFEGRSWDVHLESWLKRIPASERFVEVDGMVVALEDLTGREYFESDPPDLDHLSTSQSCG